MATITPGSEFANELANLRHRVEFAPPGAFLHIHDASFSLLAYLLHCRPHLAANDAAPTMTIGTGLSPSHLVIHYSDRLALLEALREPAPVAAGEVAARRACLDALYQAFKSRCTTGQDTPWLKATCAVILHRLELKNQPWMTPEEARELLADCLPRASQACLIFDRLGNCQAVQELQLDSDTQAARPFDLHSFQGRTLTDIGDEVRRALGAHVAHYQVDAGPIHFFADEFHSPRGQFAIRFLVVPPAAGDDPYLGITAWMAIKLLPAADNNGHGT